MADVDLRELERRWKKTGAPEDGEAYLRARTQVEGYPIRRLMESAVRIELLLTRFDHETADVEEDSQEEEEAWVPNLREFREEFRRPIEIGDILAWMDGRLAERFADQLRGSAATVVNANEVIGRAAAEGASAVVAAAMGPASQPERELAAQLAARLASALPVARALEERHEGIHGHADSAGGDDE